MIVTKAMKYHQEKLHTMEKSTFKEDIYVQLLNITP